MDIGKIAHALGEVARGALVRHLHMPPGFVRVEKDEQIGRAVALIFVIVTLGLTRCRWNWLAHFTDLGKGRGKAPRPSYDDRRVRWKPDGRDAAPTRLGPEPESSAPERRRP